jgi:DNA-binding PadR family transcriptional regulator
LATLELLAEGPKHPYDIHQTMRDRHVDRLVKLTAGTLYHTIDRLARDGLVEMVETSREGRRVWVDQLTGSGTPEMYWIDLKYRLAMEEAELAWVDEQLNRLDSGELAWPDHGAAAKLAGPTELRLVHDDPTETTSTRAEARG